MSTGKEALQRRPLDRLAAWLLPLCISKVLGFMAFFVILLDIPPYPSFIIYDIVSCSMSYPHIFSAIFLGADTTILLHSLTLMSISLVQMMGDVGTLMSCLCFAL
jgi:hypothetical protein